MKSLIPYIASSDGCVSVDVLANTQTDGTFVVLEKWVSVEHHEASVANFPQDEMKNAMKLLGGPPKGGYYRS